MRRHRLSREGEGKSNSLINDVRIGDVVKFVDAQGKVHRARIVMRSSAMDGAYVGNAGGRHGMPVIISNQNLVDIVKMRRKYA